MSVGGQDCDGWSFVVSGSCRIIVDGSVEEGFGMWWISEKREAYEGGEGFGVST